MSGSVKLLPGLLLKTELQSPSSTIHWGIWTSTQRSNSELPSRGLQDTHVYPWLIHVSSVHFSSIAQSCLTLCDPMNHSMPGLPVPHQFPEFTQTHVHRVGDAIQPSHPLSSPSVLPPILPNIRVFSNESTLHMRWPKYWSFSFRSVPPMNTQDWSPLGWTGWISLQSKGLSRVVPFHTSQNGCDPKVYK